MRLLHVTLTMSPRYGGPVAAVESYCRCLAARGHDVEVLTTTVDWPPRADLDVPAGVPVVRDGYTISSFPVQARPYLVSMGLLLAARSAVGMADLVHIHGLYRFPGMVCAWAARRAGVPYVVSPHGSLDPHLHEKPERRRLKRMYERLIEFPSLNRTAAIHYTTEEERSLAAPLGLTAPTIVAPVGVDLRFAADLPERGTFRRVYGLGEEPLVLYFGRITPKKGLDILIPAFARTALRHPSAKLVIAGPDNEGYEETVRRSCREARMADRVLFTGMIQGPDRAALLRDADIFALTSYTENFGIAVVEAMAAGLPVVISDRVNIWREIAAAEAGLVVACDMEQTTEALDRLLSDGEIRAKLARHGRKLAATVFDEQRATEQIERHYRRIIEGGLP